MPSKMAMAAVLLQAVLILPQAVLSTAGTTFNYKQLSGEPSEFQQHMVPAPQASAVSTDHTSVSFTFPASGAWSRDLTVDSSTGFAFALFTADMANIKEVALTDPSGKPIDLTSHVSEASVPISDDASKNAAGQIWSFKSFATGVYHVTVTPKSMAPLVQLRARKAARNQTQNTEDAMLVIWNDSQDRLMTHTTTMHTIQGGEIGLSGLMFDETATPYTEFLRTKVKPAALRDVVSVASLDVVSPSGVRTTILMHDDGLGADAAPGDGDYAGSIGAKEVGSYKLTASFTGKNGGCTFSRTSEHTIVVAAQAVQLTDRAFAMVDPAAKRVKLFLVLKPQGKSSHSSPTPLIKAYAEVWGKSKGGSTDVAVTYAEALGQVKQLRTPIGDIWYAELEVDCQWLAKAGVDHGLSLRNVHVEDINKLVLLDAKAALPVVHVLSSRALAAAADPMALSSSAEAEAAVAALVASTGYGGVVTKAMREGIPPAHLVKARAANVSADAPSIVLVHGFCADRNPFEVQADDWTNAVFYSSKREGNPLGAENNEFAEFVIKFIDEQQGGQGLDRFSMVGQSQGGMVILHILNYFHTGLDNSEGGRQIQSVATPYLGNSALANLGGLAGIIAGDCTPPENLAREGATQWIAGISQANIDLVNPYATQYDKGGLFGGGYCNQLMNLFLNTPNDGVCEIDYAKPETGKDLNLKVGYCHAEGMEWPPSFWDVTRNKEMDTLAAR